jgi:hypothetical protein
MVNKFREKTPGRTYTGTYSSYRSYKTHLAKDFSNRCGYTDCLDVWFGGANNFHIDHFIPWKKYPGKPNLKTDYSNLVYCCSYVNILKSDDEGDYLDPCNVDFNAHFSRDQHGNIIPSPKSVGALKMYKKLKLHLRRYQIIWMLDNLYNKMGKLKVAIEKVSPGKKKDEMLILQGELANMFVEYFDYLKKAQ